MRRSLVSMVVLIACATVLILSAPTPRTYKATPDAKIVLTLRNSASIEITSNFGRGDLWLTSRGVDRQLTHDGQMKDGPKLSPDQQRIAYDADITLPAPGGNGDEVLAEYVRVIDSQGRLLREFLLVDANAKRQSCSQFMDLTWIDNHRLGIRCRVDSDNNEYIVFNVDTGQKAASYIALCCTEVWSPDRTKVAYVGLTPHSGSPQQQSYRLEVNGKEVFPGQDKRYSRMLHNFVTPFAWAPDSARVAFLDEIGQKGVQIVVIAGEGHAAVLAPLPDALGEDDTAKLEWEDADTVRLIIDQESWTLDATTGEWTAPRWDVNTARFISPGDVTPLTAFPAAGIHRSKFPVRNETT